MSFGSSSDDRIGIADRRGEQSLRVGRRRRNRDLHARRVHVVRLRRVVVQLRRAHAAAVRHPHDERELHRPAAAPAVAADVRDQLVEARIRERVVLHLADRPPPGHAESDRAAEDPRLRERHVDAAVGAEALAQTGGRAEHAAGAADVLADHEHRRIARELDVKRVVDRLDHEEVAHDSASEHAAQLVELRGERRGRIRERVLEHERDVGIRRGLGLRDPGAHRLQRLGLHRRSRAPRRGRRACAGSARSGRDTRCASPARRARGRCTRAGRPRSRAARCDT